VHIQIFLQDNDVNSFECISRRKIAASYGSSLFQFVEEIPNCFAEWLNQVPFSRTVVQSSVFSTPSLAPVVYHWSFKYSYSKKSEMICFVVWFEFP
jgi:hypothetical protein